MSPCIFLLRSVSISNPSKGSRAEPVFAPEADIDVNVEEDDGPAPGLEVDVDKGVGIGLGDVEGEDKKAEREVT